MFQAEERIGEDHTRAFGAAAKALRKGLTNRTAADDIVMMRLSYLVVAKRILKVVKIKIIEVEM